MKGYGWILNPDPKDDLEQVYREFHKEVLKQIIRLEGKEWVMTVCGEESK